METEEPRSEFGVQASEVAARTPARVAATEEAIGATEVCVSARAGVDALDDTIA
jgi:hypothetical protein